MNTKKYSARIKDGLFCAVIAAVLLATLLFFSSALTGTDDEQLFASAAQSLVHSGEFTALQMWGNSRVMGRYTMIAPLHVFIGSLAYRLAEWLKVGRLQIFYILSPLYIALTSFLLMQMALWRGTSKKTAALAALAFGLTTIIFPYSKTFFREPLAMLLLVLVFYIIDASCIYPGSLRRNLLRLFLALFTFLLAVWTKEFLAACLPFLIYKVAKNKKVLLPVEGKSENQRRMLSWGRLALITLLAVIVVWLLQDRSGRFSISYFTRLLTYIPIMPHENFLRALLGMFFSASKGFFLYSPILLLGLFFPSTNRWKKDRQDWVFTLGATLGVAALQAFTYDANWWTFTWSTRFLLPIIPFWMLIILPFLEMVWEKSQPFKRVLVISLLVLGLVIQLGGVLISDANFSNFLWVQLNILASEERLTRWEALPALGHWLALVRGVPIDLGWVRGAEGHIMSILIAPIACALIVIFGWLILSMEKNGQARTIVPFIILVLALPLLVINAYQVDPIYSGENLVYRDALQYLDEQTSPAETILIDGYNNPLWYFYFNFSPLTNEWIGLPLGMQTSNGRFILYPRLQETIDLVNSSQGGGAKIWLVGEIKNDLLQSSYAEVLKLIGWRQESSQMFERVDELSGVSVVALIRE